MSLNIESLLKENRVFEPSFDHQWSKSQIDEIIGIGVSADAILNATLLTIKNPDESIVKALSLEREQGVTSFYPVVENKVLGFEIQGVAEEFDDKVVHSYYAEGTLLYNITLEKETGIVVDYSVNEDAFNSTSGRLNGCGFFCEGGKCVKGILEFMGGGSAEGTFSAIACGLLWEACAVGIGLGCAAVALLA